MIAVPPEHDCPGLPVEGNAVRLIDVRLPNAASALDAMRVESRMARVVSE